MTAHLEVILDGGHLPQEAASRLLKDLAAGSQPREKIAATLAALRTKGETPDEIAGFATAMRELALDPELDSSGAIDIVGTGGDGSGSFNISTGAALLVAAAEVPVIKHGNRSISSKSGSADVLVELGYGIPENGIEAHRSLESLGFTFLFAPYFHPAMAAIAPVRKALQTRTVFNILGPLTNPARPPFNLIGAFSIATARLMADALARMQTTAYVVHGDNGWDEATTTCGFTLLRVGEGEVSEERRHPSDYGLPLHAESELAGADPSHNSQALRTALDGAPGAHRDTLVLNASLAIELTGRAADPIDALELANETINDGKARTLLDRIATMKRRPVDV